MLAPSWYADLLSVLTKDRRAHSLAVGRKAAEAASGLEPWMRSDLVAAATLHDIGYGHVVSGFHPLDGARFLAGAGFSATVCHLVAHHTASTYEAEERGLTWPLMRRLRWQVTWGRPTRCCGGRT